jgi:hypothetical protein
MFLPFIFYTVLKPNLASLKWVSEGPAPSLGADFLR